MIWICRCGFSNESGASACGRCGRSRWTGKPAKPGPIVFEPKPPIVDDAIPLPPPDDGWPLT